MRGCIVTTICATLLLAACGGGGGGSAPGGGVPPVPQFTPTPAPVPTATPVSTVATLAGKIVDRASGGPLAGFTVAVGVQPDPAACNASQTASLNVCGAPAAPIVSALTDASGGFSLRLPVAGTYMLVAGRDASYATLHRTVALTKGANDLGSVGLTPLSTTIQGWLSDVNARRQTAAPTSYPNLVVDEYAHEQAQRWATDLAAGGTTFGDAQYQPYQQAYQASPGAMYGATGVIALAGNADAYGMVDQNWMAERANCPGGDWSTCPDGENTGHYIRLSNTNTVWAGFGQSPNAYSDPSYGTVRGYDVMLVENVAGAPTRSAARARLR